MIPKARHSVEDACRIPISIAQWVHHPLIDICCDEQGDVVHRRLNILLEVGAFHSEVDVVAVPINLKRDIRIIDRRTPVIDRVRDR